MPCLHDRYEEGGATKREYFWQELLVARAIYAAKPVTHVDIGSRVDSIVAHVASFREIEVMDVRPSTTAIPGIGFRQLDLMDSATLPIAPLGGGGGYCDSLSLACMRWNTLAWGVMATRSIRKATNKASPTCPSFCDREVDFTFPHPLARSGWNLMPIGFLTRAPSSTAQQIQA